MRHYSHVLATFHFAGVQYKSFDEVFAQLLEYSLRRYNIAYEKREYSLLHYYIARACNRFIWLLSGAASFIRVVHFGDSALQQIERALKQDGKKIWVFRPRTLGKHITQTLFVTLSNIKTIIIRNDYHLNYFRNTHPSDYSLTFPLPTERFRVNLKARPIHFPMPIFFDRVVADSGWYMTFLKAQVNVGKNVTRDLLPHLVMTNKGKYHFIRAAIEYLEKGKGIGVLINHGTHTAQKDQTLSQVGANLWGSDDRICFYNLSYMVPRLPLTMEQVKQIYTPNLPEFIRLKTVNRIARCFDDCKEKIKIVFAGNYVGPLSHTPWCTETADEYLLNMLELVEKISAMDRVELIIKLKARKASSHITIVQERIDSLTAGHKIRIDTQSKLLDMLVDTHLLISNLSTAIEDALSNRVPVLLHTYRKHYFHLPCAFTIDQATKPGYVYGIRCGQDLSALIESIRDNYQRIVEDDELLDGIIWKDSEYNNLKDFAESITQLANKTGA